MPDFKPSPLSALPEPEFEARMRQAVALPDAPAAWVHAAVAQFAKQAAPATTLVQAATRLWREVQAVLRFDSAAAAPFAAGVRASGAQEARHLVFNAEGRDIDLRIQPARAEFTLSGQILGPDEAGTVWLAPAPGVATVPPGAAVRAELDALGEFRFQGVAAGRYQLTLELGDERVTMPAIEVGAPSAR